MTPQERSVLYRATRYAKLMKEYAEMTNRLDPDPDLEEVPPPYPDDSPMKADALFDMAQDTLEGLEDAAEGLNPEDYQ